MTSENEVGTTGLDSSPRRRVLKAGAALAGASALGYPALGLGQAETIKIGHLTPLTGFLGALGEYSVMGIKIATDEINASGGVMGRQLDVISEDSVNPQVAATKAQRMIERDGVVVLMGEINSASALTISTGVGGTTIRSSSERASVIVRPRGAAAPRPPSP